MTAAVVLAAGKSRRMGTQKLLLPFAGRPMIVHIVDAILLAGVSPVFVVLPPQSGAVADALAALPVTPVINPDAEGDMLSSVRCGVRALPPECHGFLLALGDQPGITAELIERLMTAGKSSGKSLVVPACQGRRGHPALIGIKHRQEILTCHDGTGLRGLFHHHPDEIEEVAVDNSDTLRDADLPEEYGRLCRVLLSP
jgi:molybdenum cofactor cytidylyltransferase